MQTLKDSIRLSYSRLKIFFPLRFLLFHIFSCPGKQNGFALNHINLNQVCQKLTIDKSEYNPNQILNLTLTITLVQSETWPTSIPKTNKKSKITNVGNLVYTNDM